ncbi:ankyrin repeat-containing domain protein [Mycena capillaripes]|nr:ankyrin repeat-containing domain protein [Mycena capillaripes]
MAAVGLWMWLDPAKFGTPLPCDPTPTIIGGPTSFSSRPLQVFSLVVYGLLLTPGINLLPQSETGNSSGIATALRRPMATRRTAPAQGDTPAPPSPPSATKKSLPAEPVHTASLIGGLVLLVVINIIFVIDIELTLSRNNPFQFDNGDDVWSFGQVLALLLLVLPLRDAWNAFRNIQRARNSLQERFLQALRDEVAATPIVERLGALVIDGADPRRPINKSRFGNSLQLAAYNGKKDIVEFLLSEGLLNNKPVIDTEHGGGYGTALQAASANGQLEVVALLLKIHRTDILHYIKIEGGHYETAVCAACANGQIDVAQLLLENGADDWYYGGTLGPPLHIASLMGSIELINWLLENTNAQFYDSDRGIFGKALDVAYLMRNQEAIELLLRKGFWRTYTQFVKDCIGPGKVCLGVSVTPKLSYTECV